jgi:WD40 repeat protein
MVKSLSVFISYAQEDQHFLNELEKHLTSLRHQGIITTWSNQQISAGMAWAQEATAHLLAADVILLLISPDFLASYSTGVEMEQAMGRHERGEARVIPVLLRTVDLEGVQFEKLRKIPDVPVMHRKWHDPDEAFGAISQGLRKVIMEIQAKHESAQKQEKAARITPREKSELGLNLGMIKRKIQEIPLPGGLALSGLAGESAPSQPAVILQPSPDTRLIYQGHTSPVCVLAGSPNGDYIASGDEGGGVQIWKADTGESISHESASGLYGNIAEKRSVLKMDWSPDGQYLAAHIGGKSSSRVWIWHIATRKLLRVSSYLYFPYFRTSCFVWSPDSRYIAMDDKGPVQKGRIGVWDVATRECIVEYDRHADERNEVTTLAWAPNGKSLASGDAEGKVHIWDLTGQTRLIYHDNPEATHVRVVWSPDGKLLASGGEKGGIEVWSSNIGRPMATFDIPGRVNWLRWLPGAMRFAASRGSSINHHLDIWDLEARELFFSVARQGTLAPNGLFFAEVHKDASIQVQHIESRTVFYAYRAHSAKIVTLAWLADGRSLVSVDSENAVHVWPIQQGNSFVLL